VVYFTSVTVSFTGCPFPCFLYLLISFLFAFFQLFARSPVLTLSFPLSFLYFFTSLYSFLPSIFLLPPPPFITLTLSTLFRSVQILAERQVTSLCPSVRQTTCSRKTKNSRRAKCDVHKTFTEESAKVHQGIVMFVKTGHISSHCKQRPIRVPRSISHLTHQMPYFPSQKTHFCPENYPASQHRGAERH